ncbi:thiamine phosphate synthase [Candidatus Oleimmundimicrobium sp.]|uniref:thiamine phosphate synthase n=1 Tax=Candidatus Oleimmundimicrobium sp. TaxID=3060597 RepID=UPI0027262985|nr:thiamine phosphate synthase [Candidatus Oleimmundimicrobium sp.]MDO8885333.1 thiamine phosphate synthase [Candidatus Oleimmundimicrobium sp.]
MDLSFYVITCEVPNLKRSQFEVAKAATEGGATVIQYREKNKSSRELLEMACKIHKITQRANIPLIINDRLDIAQAVKAEGVHLGQGDISVKTARMILGPESIIGVSCGNIEEAIEAERDGASYIGVGPIFPTSTKDNARKPIGIKGLIEIKRSVNVPVVGIGGISVDNVGSVLKSGVDGVAVISAVAFASNMKGASCNLSKKIKKVREANHEFK